MSIRVLGGRMCEMSGEEKRHRKCNFRGRKRDWEKKARAPSMMVYNRCSINE